MAQTRASRPRFRRDAALQTVILTPDDVTILRTVFRHRFIRAEDLYRLMPERSPDRLSRRLAALYRAGYLDRPIAQVDRFREGGSKSLVYGLDNAGARFIAGEFGLTLNAADWRARNRSFTRENLDHTLCIARFMVDMELACRAHPSVSLLTLDDMLARAPDRTRALAQPGRWPVPVQWHGLSGTVHIIPDAIFGLAVTGADGRTRRSCIFLEIDRGTMTIAPARRVRESDAFLHRATILRKLVTYAASHRDGVHRAHLGVSARILTITTTAARSKAMSQAAREYVAGPNRAPAGLFLFGTADGSNPLLSDYVDGSGGSASLLPLGARVIDDLYNLRRFVEAQAPVFDRALLELHEGRKRTHWIWFVFPSFEGLGSPATAYAYGITSREEACAYTEHFVLGPRLRRATEAVLASPASSLRTLFGSPDDLKFCSSMTLFAAASSEPLFEETFGKWGTRLDQQTLVILAAAD